MPSRLYSRVNSQSTCRRVAPSTFWITASASRRLRPAAMVPARTKAVEDGEAADRVDAGRQLAEELQRLVQRIADGNEGDLRRSSASLCSSPFSVPGVALRLTWKVAGYS